MSRSLRPGKAISLVELIISIALLALVITGFFGIEVFSRYHLITADRRAKLQNEASYLVAHMSKHLLVAMGDFEHDAVARTASGTGFYIDAFIDDDADGIRSATAASRIRYCYQSGDCGMASQDYTVFFRAGTNPGELIVRRIKHFNVSLDETENNLLAVNLTACWDPSRADCGTSDNPSVSIQTKIRMPSVSVN